VFKTFKKICKDKMTKDYNDKTKNKNKATLQKATPTLEIDYTETKRQATKVNQPMH